MDQRKNRSSYSAPVVTDLGSHASFVQAITRGGPEDGVKTPGGVGGCPPNFVICTEGSSPV
jgi:hypothetical protein